MSTWNRRLTSLEDRARSRSRSGCLRDPAELPHQAEDILALAEKHPDMPESLITRAREHLAAAPEDRRRTGPALLAETMANGDFFANLI